MAKPTRDSGHRRRPDPRVTGSRPAPGATASASLQNPKDLTRIAGLPAVDALFATTPERVERLFFEPDLKRAIQRYTAHLARSKKPYREVQSTELARLAGTPMHGGIVAFARLDGIRSLHDDDLVRWARAGEALLALDGVGNPQNIGAIARTAAFFGLQRILLSDHPAQAGLSDASYRIAKGGLSHLEMISAPRIAQVLKRAAADYLVIGTALGTGTAMRDLKPDRRPRVIVLGNEEEGLPQATLKACGAVVTLPALGQVQSLNVSVTAGVLIHALLQG